MEVYIMFRFLLTLSVSIGTLGSAVAQDDVPVFHEGDSARVDAPAANPDGTPSFCQIFATLQEAREKIGLYAEAAHTGKAPSAEGIVAISRDTGATVRAVESAEVNGKPLQIARVRLE